MARKGWNALSPGYRQRLQKAGITQEEYDRGGSIRAARGHATTPERPAAANMRNFTRYSAERSRLVARVTQLKHDYFGTSPKWNPERAKKAFRDVPPPMERLRFWSKLSKQEWIDAIREEPDSIAFLGYH